MEIIIDGMSIKTEEDFHNNLSNAFNINQYYGKNLYALWDILSANIERPLTLKWNNSCESKKYLGKNFDLIIEVFDRVKMQDEKFGWKDKFNYILN